MNMIKLIMYLIISCDPILRFLLHDVLYCYRMGLTLHQHSHSHGGGSLESHSHDEATGRSTSNINVRAAYIHVLGDVIQSLGVLIAAVIVYFRVSTWLTL